MNTCIKPKYHSKNLVELGDIVTIRVLFKRMQGKVVYVPGISEPNSEMEFNGITYVGIKTAEGMVASTVDPETGVIKKGIRLINRGERNPSEEIYQHQNVFEDENGNPL